MKSNIELGIIIRQLKKKNKQLILENSELKAILEPFRKPQEQMEEIYKNYYNQQEESESKPMSTETQTNQTANQELKVKFTQTYEDGQSTISMQVLEQDESTRDKGVLFEKDGFQIKSWFHPELSVEKIWIRGEEKGKDDMIATLTLDTEKANKYIIDAIDLINAYNESLKVNKVKKSPYVGEEYWHIDFAGDVNPRIFQKSCHGDNWNYKSGNYYKTESEAETAKQKQILHTEMQRFADENNSEKIDWNNENQKKYCLEYKHTDKIVQIDVTWFFQSIEKVYFTENCKDQALTTFGDRYKALYGGNN